MRFRATCYRAHDPRWSFKPLSGDGAAIHGARFNPKGIAALYLALDLNTAVAEANQGLGYKIKPCVLCSYEVDCEDVVDLRLSETRLSHGIAEGDMACAWASHIAAGTEPPSWRIAMRLIGQGIIVPSYAIGAVPGSSNLVLWKWGPDLRHQVRIFDPSGQLPQNQLSWT